MSLILDALKKLEREKAAERNKTGDIAALIIEQKPVAQDRRPLVLIGAIALTAAISVAGMYIGFMYNKPAPLPTAAPSAPVFPLKAGLAPVEASSPLPAIPEPVKDLQVKLKAPPAREKAGPENLKAKHPEKKSSSPLAETVPSRPEFHISVIIWYEEASERKAVINGKTVREGDIIEGSRVEHIHPSRVSLVKDGKTFEVNTNQ